MTISTSQLLGSKIVTKTATFGVVNPVSRKLRLSETKSIIKQQLNNKISICELVHSFTFVI